jgi:hypothetical protein
LTPVAAILNLGLFQTSCVLDDAVSVTVTWTVESGLTP